MPFREPVVVIAGHVTHDRRRDGTVHAGGPAFYAARTHRALGATARLVTALGDDFLRTDELLGLQAEVRRGRATTELDRDRLIARAEPVLAVDLPEAWRRCDLLHLAPALSEIDIARWTQVTQARRIVLGVHGFTRVPAPGGAAVTRPWSIDPRVLSVVDIACVAEADLAAQGDLFDRLVHAVPIVAVTRGALGCDVIERGRTTRVGIHATRAVDPTGAGDTFAAAFGYALSRGMAAIDAAQLAAAAASIVIEAVAGAALDRVAAAPARAATIPVERRESSITRAALLSLVP